MVFDVLLVACNSLQLFKLVKHYEMIEKWMVDSKKKEITMDRELEQYNEAIKNIIE